jgi:oligosaccharide repeat unit polymerase
LTFNYYFRFSLRKKIAFGLFCIITFLLVGAVRLSQISEAGHSNYLKAAGEIEYETNLAEGWLVSYAAAPFSKFDQLVEQNESKGNFYFGKYIFRPLLSIFFLEKLDVIKYESDIAGLAGFTYAMEPYLDFSFFGTILFNIIIGFYSMHIFRRYNNCNDDSIITWAIIVFCLIMTPFTNYFTTFLIWFIWFMNQILTSFNTRDRRMPEQT